MTYPFIPIVLLAVFIITLIYMLIFRKDMKRFKMVLYPGLFFMTIWVVATVGPIALYILVTRHLSKKLKAGVNPTS